jgi:hypothetical protein
LGLHYTIKKEPLWRFHIEGLRVMCTVGSNSVTKQTDNCVTGKATDSIYHKSKGKSFNLSNFYWIVQELFKARHSNSHNPGHSNPSFWSCRLRSTRLNYQMSANAVHKLTHLKIVAYHKWHRMLQEYQCPALITVCQQSEDNEGQTHYCISHYHYSGCRWVLYQVLQTYYSVSYIRLFYGHLHSFRALSAVNYQTVCNDLNLGSVQTKSCLYRRHNTDNVRTSQPITAYSKL